MLDQQNITAGRSAPHVRIRILLQMAEALEDEAGGLSCRAAAFEEEEFLLNREIEERQTEISRLQLKLEALRSTRNHLLEKIGALLSEADAMREEGLNNEEELQLAIEADPPEQLWGDSEGDARGEDSIFFQRASL